MEIAGHLPLPIFWLGITQYQNCQRLQSKAPDHAEGVQSCQHINVASAKNNGQELQPDNQINDAIAGAESSLRLLEPVGEYAIFRHPVQDAVRAYDRSILRSGQYKHAN